MNQHTISNTYSFEGVGLHTGKRVRMVLAPAPAGTGIVFRRTDRKGAEMKADISNFHRGKRSTMLRSNGVSVRTVEHLLSAFAGLGVDNAFVELDGSELPIMDGSARPFAEVIAADGLAEQTAQREVITVREPFEYRDDRRGSFLRIEPDSAISYQVKIDFNSKVIGVQEARFDGTGYLEEIAPSRTFCFKREVRLLRLLGLIKGGSLENALVIDEPDRYLGLQPAFDNECARHKLLDLIGDFSLAGRPIAGRITAYKPGHKFNATALRAFLETVNL
ncbi:MAG: UDP-3-O-[3-hydroxymyristoyl] N-acetylglucosamine deacetylase [Bacteroidales bacterium]|nr:UDP-3-O-[3-hydroxymyristoyl] N-acetylglucosamine deacetylase [Candidatus Cacconaster equifaecalis]